MSEAHGADPSAACWAMLAASAAPALLPAIASRVASVLAAAHLSTAMASSSAAGYGFSGASR